MGNIGSSSTKVREFSISGQKLKLDNVSDVSEFVKQLNKAKGLEIVNLSGNTLGLEACKAIAAALEGHLTLQEVNLSDCFTGRLKEDVPPAIEAFGKVLADKPALKIIDFSDNAFSPAGATALSFFLANCTSLEELRLNNNGLGPDGGKIIANGLKENRLKSQVYGKASVLRRVTIGRNRLENGSSQELAEAFSLHENLEDVALFQNGIRPEGIVALSQGISKCLKLKSLDLQDNTFTAKGSKALASAIPSWSELACLNIGDCLLSDDGCKEIVSKLVSSPAASKLTVLNLQYAEMESETAQFLASNLGVFTSLEKLFLNGNCFASEGNEVEQIKAALLPTTILDELDDMDFEEESDVEESETEETSDRQIVSTPSPKMSVDEVADVTEIIGAMNIKESDDSEDVTMTEAINEVVEDTKEAAVESFETAKEAVMESVEASNKKFNETVEATNEATAEAVEATKEFTAEAVDATEEAIADAVEDTKEAYAKAEDFTADAIETADEAIDSAIEQTDKAINDAYVTTKESLIEAAENTQEFMNETAEAAQEAYAKAEDVVADAIETTDDAINKAIEATNEAVNGAGETVAEATNYAVAQATETAIEVKESTAQAVDDAAEAVQSAVAPEDKE